MTGKHTFRTLLLIVITAACATASVYAQDATITSSVNTQVVPVNGRVVLTITISGPDAGKAAEPVIAEIPSFTIHQSGTSRSIEIINFKTSVSMQYSYILVPQKAGSFEVGTASTTIDGKTINARPVTVKVTDAPTSPAQTQQQQTGTTAQPQQGNDNIFVAGTIDKRTAFVGEQITYTFELFNRLSTSDIEYAPPTTTGFWTVELPNIPASIIVHNNRQYNHNVVKTALFPTTAGELAIGPASISYVPRLSFFTTGSAQTLNTKPLTVTIKPLPAQGKPSGFAGAVGTFEITASADRDTVRVGEVVTITVSVTGTGNLDLLSQLREPDLSAYKTYPPRVADTIHNSGFTVGGIKTWEYMIVPAIPGQVVIDSFALPFFDPAREQYRTSETEPISLTVLPGITAAGSGTSNTATDVADMRTAQDIRYLKPPRTALGSAPPPFHTSWLFWFLHVLPATGFAGAVWYKRRRDRIERDTGLKRKLLAWKLAQTRLKKAADLHANGDNAIFCGALHDTMTGYIADMLNIDTGAMTARDLELLLCENNISGELAERIRKTLELCDFVRFASIESGNDTHQALLDETAEYLNRLRERL